MGGTLRNLQKLYFKDCKFLIWFCMFINSPIFIDPSHRQYLVHIENNRRDIIQQLKCDCRYTVWNVMNGKI